MPATQSKTAQSTVKKTYVVKIALAICDTRGSTFSERSENSLRKSCIPPIFIIGITVNAITMIPIPPTHCKSARHNTIPEEEKSMPRMTEAPVVVNPEIASKNASTGDIVLLEKINGKAAKIDTTTQLKVVKIKVS